MPHLRLFILPFIAAVSLIVVPVAQAFPPPSVSVKIVDGEAVADPPYLEVNWTTGDASPGALYRSVEGAPYTLVSFFEAYGQQALKDVSVDRPQRFQVRQVGNAPKVLVNMDYANRVAKVVSVSPTIPPREVSRWVERAVQFAPAAFGLLLLLLTAAYVRSLRGLRHA